MRRNLGLDFRLNLRLWGEFCSLGHSRFDASHSIALAFDFKNGEFGSNRDHIAGFTGGGHHAALRLGG